MVILLEMNEHNLQEFDEITEKYFNCRKYKEGFKSYMKLAEKGNAYAQCRVGYMYNEGLGIDKDYKKGFEWYIKSANQGYAIAENNLGYMYYEGLGIKKDDKKAVEWYIKSANNGYSSGQFNVGMMFINVCKDAYYNIYALKMFLKSENQGHLTARNKLMDNNTFMIFEPFIKKYAGYLDLTSVLVCYESIIKLFEKTLNYQLNCVVRHLDVVPLIISYYF